MKGSENLMNIFTRTAYYIFIICIFDFLFFLLVFKWNGEVEAGEKLVKKSLYRLS